MVCFEEEFRSQNSGVRIKTLEDSLSASLSVGDSDRAGIEDHQIFNLVGVQKRRLFRRSCVANAALSAFSVKIHSEF
jgi:hypothetical protein